MDILRFYVDMVEQHIFQSVQCAGAIGYQWEEFADVENYHIFKANLSFTMHLDEFGIYAVGADAGSQCQYAFAFLVDITLDVPHNTFS